MIEKIYRRRTVLTCQLILGLFLYAGYGEEKDTFIKKIISGSPNSPYQLSWSTDLSYTLGAGTIFFLGPKIIPSNKKTYSLHQVQPGHFTKKDVNAFDRITVGPMDESFHNISHQINNFIFFTPLLLFAGQTPRHDAAKVLLMYAEMFAVYRLVTILVNPWVARKRPFFYSDEEPAENKLPLEAQSSFVSGHTNMAFCYSILTAAMFADYYPNSKWKIPVWISAFTGAATVAVLRCAAHKHFPTDVMAGAITGSCLGFSIPFFHRKPVSKRIKITPLLGEYTGLMAKIRIGH